MFSQALSGSTGYSQRGKRVGGGRLTVETFGDLMDSRECQRNVLVSRGLMRMEDDGSCTVQVERCLRYLVVEC